MILIFMVLSYCSWNVKNVFYQPVLWVHIIMALNCFVFQCCLKSNIKVILCFLFLIYMFSAILFKISRSYLQDVFPLKTLLIAISPPVHCVRGLVDIHIIME